ncbi:MAG: NADH-quinone oxidoreductase subunit C [Anaerolineae bacterium]|nr:NADH-quinone oxidoreductase subunit C [Anaerolineae bacterium]
MLSEPITPVEDLLKQAEAILIPWIPEEAIQGLDDGYPLMLNYTDRRIKVTGTGFPDCLDVNVSAEELLTVIQTLLDNDWGYLATITGVDLGVEAGEIEVLYHFCHGTAVVTLSVKVPRENPVVPSICGIIPSASFYERELLEMFGVTITNTPNTDHLFLPDNWPDNTYPLRKDFVMHAN